MNFLKYLFILIGLSTSLNVGAQSEYPDKASAVIYFSKSPNSSTYVIDTSRNSEFAINTVTTQAYVYNRDSSRWDVLLKASDIYISNDTLFTSDSTYVVIAPSDLSNVVTLTGDQTITGDKTFLENGLENRVNHEGIQIYNDNNDNLTSFLENGFFVSGDVSEHTFSQDGISIDIFDGINISADTSGINISNRTDTLTSTSVLTKSEIETLIDSNGGGSDDQQISINAAGDTIFLEDGGFVELPASSGGGGIDSVSFDNDTLSIYSALDTIQARITTNSAWVNILDFGADPTTGNDDSPAWNLAMATGKNVYLPDGDYTLELSGQFIPSGIKVWGAGANNTIIRLNSSEDFILQDYSVLAYATVQQDVNNSDGIQLGDYCELNHCIINSFSAEAILVTSQALGVRINNCQITNSQSGLENKGYGTVVRNCSFSNNSFTDVNLQFGTNGGMTIEFYSCIFASNIYLDSNTTSYQKYFGCTFEGATLKFDSRRMEFTNCLFDTGTSMTIERSEKLFMGCTFNGSVDEGSVNTTSTQISNSFLGATATFSNPSAGLTKVNNITL